MSTKKENYTKENVEFIIDAFNLVTTYEQQAVICVVVAGALTKTERQISGKVSHLSRSGITKESGEPLYISKTYAPVGQAKNVLKKADIVSSIADLLISAGKLADAAVIESLEAATRPALLILLDGLTPREVEEKSEEV